MAWNEDDRVAVASGRLSLTELAAARGVSKQAASQAFLRKGWPTRPDEPAEQASKPARASRTPASARETARSVIAAEGGSGGALEAPRAPPAPIICLWPDDEDEQAELAQLAQLRILNVSMLTLAHAERLLSGPQLGPSALKATVQAAEIAAARLEKLAGEHASAAPKMIIREMTAQKAEEIRDQAEAEWRGEFTQPALDDAEIEPHSDDLAEDSEEMEPPEPPSSADIAKLGRRLDAAAARLGNIWLRTQAVALGIRPAHARSELVSALLDAAGRDTAVAAQLDAELARSAA